MPRTSEVEYDDELPEPVRMPRPEGWFELFCCGTTLALVIAVIVILGVVR